MNRVSDFMGGNCNCREGLSLEDRGCETDRFTDWIVVVAYFGRFDGDVRHVEPIEQVSGQFSSGSRVVRTGRTMFSKDPSGPELRSKNDQADDDEE